MQVAATDFALCRPIPSGDPQIFCLARLQTADDYRHKPCMTDASPRHEAQFVVTAHFDTPESETGRSKGSVLSCFM